MICCGKAWVEIDFFGGCFASPAGRSRNQRVPDVDASASFCARGASARRITGAPAAAAGFARTFGASRPRTVPAATRDLVVDVDPVATRDYPVRPWVAPDGQRDRSLQPRELDGIASVRPALRSAVVICWPGKMSATATRPLRYAGSEIAPSLRSSLASVAAWKSCFSAITVPDVPFGIRFFATRTGVGAVESLTLERYWTRYAIRRIAASAAAAIPARASSRGTD